MFVLQLHDSYTKICQKRQMAGIDYSEYQGVATLLETRGIIAIKKPKDGRMAKVGISYCSIEDMCLNLWGYMLNYHKVHFC